MKKMLLLMMLCLSVVSVRAESIYQQALDNPQRPIEDREADSRRLPQQVLAFFELQAGQNVLDLFSGGGYYTELASIIVGDSGHVDAHNNQAYIRFIGEDKLLKRYQNGRLKNVSQLHQEANDLQLCLGCYDRILMILTFHDLYYVDDKNGWPAIEADALMEKVHTALKPGGTIGIIDHNAVSGSGIEVAQRLHRIDPQFIKERMLGWGFQFKAEAGFLANPADSGELPMWDPSVKGHTNRTVLLFSK